MKARWMNAIEFRQARRARLAELGNALLFTLVILATGALTLVPFVLAGSR